MIETHPIDPADLAPRAQLRAHAAPAKGTTGRPESRAAFDQLMARLQGAPDVEYAEDRVAGVPGWWARPAGARRDAVLLHLHGGGFVVGSAKTHRFSVGQIASHAGLATFIPDYRLAPEHPYPAAPDDVAAVFAALAKDRAVFVSGDSAGGNLALTLVAQRPRALVLLSPWLDLTNESPSLVTRADADPYLTAAGLAGSAKRYYGDADPRDPRISPLYAPPTDLPILVHVGDDEILLDDALRFAARNPNTATHVWMGMPHVFPSNVGLFRASALAQANIGEFLRSFAI